MDYKIIPDYKDYLNGTINSAYHASRFNRAFSHAELFYLAELVRKVIKDNGIDNDIEYHGPDNKNPSGIKSLKHYVLNVIEG